jgi:chromosome segregation ATPase
MARKIAIELEVNGVKESVNTIGELETAIEQLTEELKNTDIGSERFQQLTTELNSAKSELKAFEQTFEGLDPQQKTQAYLAFGESIVSGILLAQEALRVFGIENEEVNAAVEKSTQAINVALQARIVIEGVLEARVLATSLAQKALNTSIVAGNRVLKALFLTIQANPVGFLLAGIAALATAFIALSDSSDESTDSLEENEAAQKSLELQSKRLKRELTELNDATNDYIDSVDDFDLSTAISEVSRLEQELSDLNETQDEVRDLDFEEIALSLVRDEADLNDFNLSLAEQKTLFDILIEATDKYEGSLRKAQGTNAEIQQKNLKNIERVSNELQEQIERTEGNTEALEKQLAAVNKRVEQLRAEISKREFDRFTKSLEDAGDELDRLNEKLLEFGETPSPKIIDELEELVQLQLELQKATEESRKTLGDTFNDYFTTIKESTTATDDFGESYEETRKALTQALETGDFEKFNQEVERTQEKYFGEDSDFNKEQKNVINQLISSYSSLFQQIQGFGAETEEEFSSVITPLLDSLAQKLRLEGDLQFVIDKDEVEETIDEALPTGRLGGARLRRSVDVDISGVVDESDFSSIARIFKEQEDIITEYELDLQEAVEGTDEFYRLRSDLVNRFTEEFLKQADFVALAAEDEQKAQEAARQAAEERVESIINITTETAKVEDSIRGVSNEVEDLRNQVRENNSDIDTLLGLILTNFDDIKDQIDLTELDPTATLETNFEAISKFFEDIGFESFDVLVRTEQDKLDIVELFLKKRQELIDNQAKEEKETQEDLLQTTFDNYSEIISGLNQLTLSLSEASQLQIERVEANTEEALSNIVGDTKEAEELRTEIQEESNEKIVEIERRARLRELQFTKIQATADLAQALINALKLPPPFNAIQASIIGTAGSIQIATIQGQIDDLQSAQGFATGGYVEGPGSGTSDSIPAMLSNGEFVVNAKATQKFLPLLEEINDSDTQFRKFANGGYVLDTTIPTTSTIQNIFDDSRIIEELRKTRQEPLRAYVFEKDITEAQQIEKRLQELSKL